MTMGDHKYCDYFVQEADPIEKGTSERHVTRQVPRSNIDIYIYIYMSYIRLYKILRLSL